MPAAIPRFEEAADFDLVPYAIPILQLGCIFFLLWQAFLGMLSSLYHQELTLNCSRFISILGVASLSF